jgi:hypothetical protein
MSDRSDFLKEFALGARISAGMRERLVLMHDRCAAVQQETEALKSRCAELEQRCDELEQQTANATELGEFIELRGAKFRQLPDGTIERQVYCPKCRNPMTTPTEDFLPYRCAPCHYLSPLKGFDFPSILEELSAPALHGA